MPDWASLIGFKDRDELLELVATHLRDAGSKLTNWNKLGRLRTVAEALSQPVAELFVLLLKIVPHGYARHARLGWLDLHAEDRGQERLPAKRTTGWVTIHREPGVAGNVAIPAGRRIGTKVGPDGKSIAFRSTSAAVLPDGQDTLLLHVESEEAGAHTIVGPSTLTVLLTPTPGIGSVTNGQTWLESEGADKESDEALQARLVLLWTALGFGSNRDAHEAWAREVAGVVDAWVDDQHPRGQGTIDIYITSTAGAPTQELLDAVAANVALKKNPTSDVLVLSPAVVALAPSLDVWVAPDAGPLDEIEAAAAELVTALFLPNAALNATRVAAGLKPVSRLRIAEDVRPSRLASLAFDVEGVVDAKCTVPLENVPVGPGALAVLSGPVVVTATRLETL